jgi:transketolase
MISSVDPRALRRLILEQSYRAKVGHIGSALSIADIIAALFGGILRDLGTDDRDRDLFILSKGHAALALYAGLRLRNIIDQDMLDTYCADGSLLAVHPEHELRGVEFSTGSLGLGLSLGAGAAYGAKLLGSPSRTYVLISDAELNEGEIWEAVMFGAHHRLDNLTAIIDLNGQQALGHTIEVIDLTPLRSRWEAFGWHVLEVDGHDVDAITKALRAARAETTRPTVVIAKTVAGRGVSFMEGRVEWHYLPLDQHQFRIALDEVAG